LTTLQCLFQKKQSAVRYKALAHLRLFSVCASIEDAEKAAAAMSHSEHKYRTALFIEPFQLWENELAMEEGRLARVAKQ
jgi:hypothetical protein